MGQNWTLFEHVILSHDFSCVVLLNECNIKCILFVKYVSKRNLKNVYTRLLIVIIFYGTLLFVLYNYYFIG